MEKWNKKTACVAGGNSGMGAALVKFFLDAKIKVIAVDKNVEKLEKLQTEDENGENLIVIQADVTKDDQLSKCMQMVEENSSEINIVTHSIGCVGNVNLIDGELVEWQKLVNVNVIGFCSFMKEIVNLMLKQNVKDGRIIILNSIVVLDPVVFPELHFYSGTKCAIDTISRALQYEIVQKKGSIKITNLFAGLVKTDMYKNSLGPNYETSFFKTLLSLSVKDITESVEYVLRSPINLKISRLVICPRGVFKPNTY